MNCDLKVFICNNCILLQVKPIGIMEFTKNIQHNLWNIISRYTIIKNVTYTHVVPAYVKH